MGGLNKKKIKENKRSEMDVRTMAVVNLSLNNEFLNWRFFVFDFKRENFIRKEE